MHGHIGVIKTTAVENATVLVDTAFSDHHELAAKAPDLLGSSFYYGRDRAPSLLYSATLNRV
jgi:hypothetical protein